jgi:ribosomal-protein-alanine N-acetyltransferase
MIEEVSDAEALIAATPLHAAWCASLHAASFPPKEAWSAEAFATSLALGGGFGFIIPAGALLLARAAGGEGEILTLAVHPLCRRRGFAKKLLGAALAEAARRGAETVFLEVAADNEAALALYQKTGFIPCGQRRGYYGRGRDAITMLWRRMPVENGTAGALDGGI